MSSIWNLSVALLLLAPIAVQATAIAQSANPGGLESSNRVAGNTLIAMSPEVRSMCEQAEQLINSRRFSDAERLLTQAVSLDPSCAEVHGYLGMAYQNSQNTKQAIAEYQMALRLGPQMSFLNVNLGNCYLNAGQPDQAVPYFQRYLQANPNAPDAAQVRMAIQQAGSKRGQQDLRALVEQGQALLNQHRDNEARQAFEKVVSTNPNWAPGHFFLGYALAQSGEHQQAIAQFQNALQLDPKMNEAVMNIASNYQSLGDCNSAISWYERYLQQDPGSPKAGDIRNRINGLRQQASKQNQQPRQQFTPAANPNQAGAGISGSAGYDSKNSNQAISADSDPYAGLLPAGASLSASTPDSSPGQSGPSSPGQSAPNLFGQPEQNGLGQAATKTFAAPAQPMATQSPAGQPADDYLESAVSGGKYFRWPADKMPIRVYIYPGSGAPGYRDSFARALADSFSIWQKGSESRISFWMVQDPAQADITCDWTGDPAVIQNAGGGGEGGSTKLSGQADPDGINVRIVRAKITILTKPRSAAPMSDDDIKKVCLHEVGHALGLNGHSNNNHDVMFFSESPSVWPALTKRDRATVNRLYSNYPRSVETSPVN